MRYLYTAITAGCDELRPTGPLPPGWRAVCFTDAPLEHPDWEPRPVPAERDPVRSARRVKVLAHEALPDAELSVWIDGNFNVEDDLEALVARHLSDGDLAMHRHPQRDCLYDEGVACVVQGKDDPAAIIHQLLRYARAGYPEHAGLPATGVIMRRHTRLLARFENTWWAEIAAGSRRDQIAVGWALRAHDLAWTEIDSHLWDGPAFTWRRHDGPARRRAAAAR